MIQITAHPPRALIMHLEKLHNTRMLQSKETFEAKKALGGEILKLGGFESNPWTEEEEKYCISLLINKLVKSVIKNMCIPIWRKQWCRQLVRLIYSYWIYCKIHIHIHSKIESIQLIYSYSFLFQLADKLSNDVVNYIAKRHTPVPANIIQFLRKKEKATIQYDYRDNRRVSHL